jgi:hypothetical protein
MRRKSKDCGPSRDPANPGTKTNKGSPAHLFCNEYAESEQGQEAEVGRERHFGGSGCLEAVPTPPEVLEEDVLGNQVTVEE